MKITSHLFLALTKSMESIKVLLIDFDDSFTYNIASELYRLGITVDIIPFHKIEKPIDYFVVSNNYNAIILGPGPGHPNDYFETTEFIDNLILEDIYIFGICLGHQLISKHFGFNIRKSAKAMHGEAEDVYFPRSFFGEELSASVQRYNSLAVVDEIGQGKEGMSLVENKYTEVVAIRGKNILSYQFHPESVGTSCRKRLFQPFVDFLYNSIDEDGNKN